MRSMGAQSSNELQVFELKIGYQDRSLVLAIWVIYPCYEYIPNR